ncbi:MAG: hypothetical protein EBS55_09930 [Flavobacteriaceae bacterium]|nr:hypothetical protein [Flavobacteriaceae bacterium]
MFDANGCDVLAAAVFSAAVDAAVVSVEAGVSSVDFILFCRATKILDEVLGPYFPSGTKLLWKFVFKKFCNSSIEGFLTPIFIGVAGVVSVDAV